MSWKITPKGTVQKTGSTSGLSVSEQALAEQKKRAKRERAAEKRRKKTRDKHRAQGLEHVRNYRRDRKSGQNSYS